MPSLLNIPLELRDQIIELCLCSCDPPPARPDIASREAAKLDHSSMAWDFGITNTLYEKGRGEIANSLPLLLVNRQFSTDTKNVLAWLAKSLTYRLDIVLLNELWVLPTWLCFPTVSNHVENFVVTIRVLGICKKGEYSNHPFVIGDGSPPQIYWCFYSLFERFVKSGRLSSSTQKEGTRDQRVFIQNLTLDFVNSEDNDNDPHLQDILSGKITFGDWYDSRRRSPLRTESGIIDCFLRPEWLAQSLGDAIKSLVSTPYYESYYGSILQEQIGTIQICVNSKLQTSVNVAENLAEFKLDDPSGDSGNT
ncbi:hypothetical protein PRK78_004075 [Emydomyces testavorans]|uniref:Uncharacterized protein n=1 Tax=Emydomyces testavorans TaxID=2070801 RepID=A0AAF0DHD7_9EURO|nr:hypothetical protein PRK78_004075 [Emydomyces testavorans]